MKEQMYDNGRPGHKPTLRDNPISQFKYDFGLTNREAAEKLNLTVNQVQKIETGRHNPPLYVMAYLAGVYHKPIEVLFSYIIVKELKNRNDRKTKI